MRDADHPFLPTFPSVFYFLFLTTATSLVDDFFLYKESPFDSFLHASKLTRSVSSHTQHRIDDSCKLIHPRW